MLRPAFLLLLAGCTPDPSSVDVCELEHQGCPECYSGEVECTYGETTVVAGSCGTCQAEEALFVALCEAGVTATVGEVEAGRTCVTLEAN
ncbi:MAG: hypothetical protein H6734_14780 [Alphaproteobacteria bacterium]|nr:hypothetical protein [Alphaproteobacteria bacterium]